MIHENPTGRSIKVLVPVEKYKHLRRLQKGFPKEGYIQVDFTPSGTCTSIKPTGLPGRTKRYLEADARLYLRKEGVLQ